ncbi:MAG: acetyl-CoA carboxylase carboxyltransferase subunit alpha [Alphaproteobacteria bacterium]|nr:acetyl-CoA carboxylase carboxyltransferase subunit alpha [Alphaproteobacteria bacterium]
MDNSADIMTLDFEKNIAETQEKIKHFKEIEATDDINIDSEITRLQQKLSRLVKNTYANLTPWQKTLVARHPDRPHCLDYINGLITDFEPLCGDRLFADDLAMVAGIGKFQGKSVVVIGQEKGHDLESRVKYNFGMARPEGYRKAQRLMDLADKFNFPVIAFVDTSGAFPGIDAEERGQAEAIASSIERCLNLKVPFVSIVIGEGGSGGAIAIATANRILMLEHSIYSVISPEGCASILWRSADKAKEASEALCLTAQDLRRLGVIDEIITEPFGGAHRHHEETIKRVGEVIARHLKELSSQSGADLKRKRTEKFLKMGRHLAKPE